MDQRFNKQNFPRGGDWRGRYRRKRFRNDRDINSNRNVWNYGPNPPYRPPFPPPPPQQYYNDDVNYAPPYNEHHAHYYYGIPSKYGPAPNMRYQNHMQHHRYVDESFEYRRRPRHPENRYQSRYCRSPRPRFNATRKYRKYDEESNVDNRVVSYEKQSNSFQAQEKNHKKIIGSKEAQSRVTTPLVMEKDETVSRRTRPSMLPTMKRQRSIIEEVMQFDDDDSHESVVSNNDVLTVQEKEVPKVSLGWGKGLHSVEDEEREDKANKGVVSQVDAAEPLRTCSNRIDYSKSLPINCETEEKNDINSMLGVKKPEKLKPPVNCARTAFLYSRQKKLGNEIKQVKSVQRACSFFNVRNNVIKRMQLNNANIPLAKRNRKNISISLHRSERKHPSPAISLIQKQLQKKSDVTLKDISAFLRTKTSHIKIARDSPGEDSFANSSLDEGVEKSRFKKNTRSSTTSMSDRRELGNIIATSSMLNSDIFAQDMVFDKFASAERRIVNSALLPQVFSEERKMLEFVPSMKKLTVDKRTPKCVLLSKATKCYQNIDNKISPALSLLKGKTNKQLYCNCAKSVSTLHRMNRRFADIEKLLFIEKFIQYPKNFRKICLSFRNRNCKDMVYFYYLSKRIVNYKELLRENFHRNKLTEQPSWELVFKAGLKLGVNFSVSSGILEKFKEREIILGKLAIYTKIKEFRTEYSPPLMYPEEEEIVEYSLNQYNTKEERLAAITRVFPPMNISFSDIVSDTQYTPLAKAVLKLKVNNYHNSKPESKTNTRSIVLPAQNLPPITLTGKTKWSQAEKELFLNKLRVHGKSWKIIASYLPSKSVQQVRNYYQNYKARLKLDSQLPFEEKSKRNANTLAEQLLADTQTVRTTRSSKKVVSETADKLRIPDTDLKTEAISRESLSLQNVNLKKKLDKNPPVNLNNPSVAAALASLPPSTLQNIINSGVLGGLLDNGSSTTSNQFLPQQPQGNSSPLTGISIFGNNLELELVHSVRAVFDEIRKKVDVAQVAYATQLNSLTEAFLSTPNVQTQPVPLSNSHLQSFQMGLLELQQMIIDTKKQLVSEYATAKTAMVDTLVRSGAKGVVLQVFDTEDQVASARFEQLEANANYLNLQAIQKVQQHQQANQKLN